MDAKTSALPAAWRFSVGASYGFNLVGMGEVPGVGFCAGGQAAGLELGSPGAVGDEKAVGEPLE